MAVIALAPARDRRRQTTGRPRVLQVVHRLQPGGTEHLVIELCRRLAGGFEIAVCCLDDEGAWAPDLRASGIEVVALHRRPGFRPGIGRRLARFAAARGTSLLHCHQYSPFVYGCLSRLWRPSLRLLYTEHGRLDDRPPSLKRRLANPLLAYGADAIVAVSHELRGYLAEARFPERRVHVVYNGIACGRPPLPEQRTLARETLGLDDSEFVLMSVARLDPVKHLHTLLDAVARVRRARPACRLILVGDGPERASLDARAALPDLSGAVSLLGMRADVRSLLPAADVFVNSSISEGVSVTILEALAAGVPVVATAVGGTPEVLSHRAGVLVPARDPAALAGALLALAGDPARRAALGAAGRARVERAFTIERMVREYEDWYRQLLD